MSWTGNTLGLNGASPGNRGTSGTIGAFVTTDNTTYGNFPSGTTSESTLNNSTATLDIPAGSTIVYAELIWAGSWNINAPEELDSPIRFTTQDNQTHTILPRTDTADSSSASDERFYVRSANVTSLVQANGAGVYAAGGVPGSILSSTNNRNFTGWTLAVAYENLNMAPTNINIYVSFEITTTPDPSPPVQVTDFQTPLFDNFSARMFVAAGEGDSAIIGDRLLIGQTSSLSESTDAVSGSNNPINNFFSSQINTVLPVITDPETGKLISQGSSTLDRRGTFGTSNAIPGSSAVAGRQGFDITSVDVSDKFVHSQTEAYAQGKTTGDYYVIVGLGIQIQSTSPLIEAVKSVSPTTAVPGDSVSYTVTFTNSSEIPADNAIFKDILPQGMVLVPNSFFINGTLVAAPDLVNGVPIGSIALVSPVTIIFDAEVVDYHDSYENFATLEYTFVPFIDTPPIPGSVITNSAYVQAGPIDAPIATDKTNTTNANTPLLSQTSLLDSDTGTGIEITSFTQPSEGQVFVFPRGRYIYRPPAGFSGTTSFVYTITDIANQSDSAEVTIIVLPVANNDIATTFTDATLVGESVLSNDEGTVLTIDIDSFDTTSFEGGTVLMNLDGTYEYTPPSGFSGVDSFTYVAKDSVGQLTNEATVVITVLQLQ